MTLSPWAVGQLGYMAQANQAAEPSMEEILASIRRIISDEHTEAKPEEEGLNSAAEEEAAPVEEVPGTAEPAQEEPLVMEPQAIQAAPEEDMTAIPAAQSTAEDELDAVLEQTEETVLEEEPLVLPENAIEEVIEPAEAQAEPEAMPLMLTDVMEDEEKSDDLDIPAGLMSSETDEAVSLEFRTLERLLAEQNKTLDGLSTELLRPLLKEWLDENLPQMVERLVREEIQRVARGTEA